MIPGSNIPVDISHVVAKLIFADLAESHAPSFKGRMIFTREDIAAQPPAFDLDFPYLF